MNDDLLQAITLRFELVQRRLEALNQEKTTLDAEKEHLAMLINVYISRKGYDPIEEERRITERLLTKVTPPPLGSQPATPPTGRKRNSNYDSALKLIFEENNNTPLNLTELHQKLKELVSPTLLLGTTHKIIQARLNDNFLKIAKTIGRSKYYAYNTDKG